LHLLSLGDYSGLNWTIPENLTREQIKEWIKCFFDCEAYVNHYSKSIQVKSINYRGLKKIQKAYKFLSPRKKR
jgi:hypothetical protein